MEKPIKQTRNPERTKSEIFKAGEIAFAQKGFEGCSLTDILGIAKVNKRMIYHYFGDKQGLYEAIFTGQWDQLRNDIGEDIINFQGTAREKLQKILFTLFDYFKDHQNFLRLIMWEGLEGTRISAESWSRVRRPIYGPILEAIEEAIQNGEINQEFDPVQLVVTFLGDILFYFGHSRGMVADMVHNDALNEAEVTHRRKHLSLLLDSIFINKIH